MVTSTHLGRVFKINSSLEPESELATVLVPFFAGLISFGVSTIVFNQLVMPFEHWRKPLTEFAFAPPIHNLNLILALFLGGMFAVRYRFLLVMALISILAMIFIKGGFAYSGPAYMAMAQGHVFQYRYKAELCAWLSNSGMLMAWITWSMFRAKLQASKSQ